MHQVGSGVQLVGSALATLSRGGAIAYGNCYIWDFGGYVNAITLNTATINWTYIPDPQDTIHHTVSIHSGTSDHTASLMANYSYLKAACTTHQSSLTHTK